MTLVARRSMRGSECPKHRGANPRKRLGVVLEDQVVHRHDTRHRRGERRRRPERVEQVDAIATGLGDDPVSSQPSRCTRETDETGAARDAHVARHVPVRRGGLAREVQHERVVGSRPCELGDELADVRLGASDPVRLEEERVQPDRPRRALAHATGVFSTSNTSASVSAPTAAGASQRRPPSGAVNPMPATPAQAAA